MRAFILALALVLPRTLWADPPVASLADGREGTIFFASSTPTSPDQYLGVSPRGARSGGERCAPPSCR